MSYRIVILTKAKRDVRSIARWLASRSPAGAANWLAALDAALEKLRLNPLGFGVAPEQPRITFEIRQIVFKTPRGKRYRAVYLVADDEVRVLRVRRPGIARCANAIFPLNEGVLAKFPHAPVWSAYPRVFECSLKGVGEKGIPNCGSAGTMLYAFKSDTLSHV